MSAGIEIMIWGDLGAGGVERQGMADVKERNEFTIANETQDTGCNFNARSHTYVA